MTARPFPEKADKGRMPKAVAHQQTHGTTGLNLREGLGRRPGGTDFDAILQEGLQSLARQVQAHHEYLMQAKKHQPFHPQGARFSVAPSALDRPCSADVGSFRCQRPMKAAVASRPQQQQPPGVLQTDDEQTSVPQVQFSHVDDVDSVSPEEPAGVREEVSGSRRGSMNSSIASVGRPQAGGEGQAQPALAVSTTFELTECWQTKTTKASMKKLKDAVASALLDGNGTESDEESASETESESSSNASEPGCIERCARRVRGRMMRHMISPNAPFRSCWDSFACMLVLYECVMIPLSLFDLGTSLVLDFIGWIVRLFWTLDFPLSFFTGYMLPGDVVELRPEKVIPHYARTWMSLDVSMLCVDWAEVAIGGVGSLNAARMGKTIKSIRMIRMMRLWRLLNVNQLPESVRVLFHYYFQSEVSRIVLGICKIFIFLVWVNHVLACAWYGVGDLSLQEGSWLQQPRFQDLEIFPLYMLSYHWSLTLFAGSTDVYPSNVYERTYSVCALLLCFILSASIVSSITTSMTRLSIARSKETTKLAALKEYLKENHISSRTALRVQRNAQHALDEMKRRTPEEDIELLAFISEPLRVELRFEITMPRLRKHAPLGTVEQESPTFARQMCFKACRGLSLSRADVLFVSGVETNQMYFFTSGKLNYFQDISNREEFYGNFSERRTVSAGDWACEASLWTAWHHRGTLQSRTQCSVLTLDAGQFQSLATQFKDALPFLHEYAKRFLKVLNVKAKEELTDLYDPEYDISIVARESREAAEEARASYSSASLKRGSSNHFSAVPSVSRRNGNQPHDKFWLTGIFGRRRDDKSAARDSIAADGVMKIGSDNS